MFEKYISRTDFSSYEDFYDNFKIIPPKQFNFGFDIVDGFAEAEPDKLAMVWCDDEGGEERFTFADIKKYSNKAANIIKAQGIKKGDAVMLLLKRRYEFWFCMVALHKIGAIAIPATHLLTKKDIVYRNNAADIKMIIACKDDELLGSIDESTGESKSLQSRLLVGGKREGWLDMDEAMQTASSDFPKPSADELPKNDDLLLLFFTSGTTGLPKMVAHDYIYPLGHILTAKYWHRLHESSLHITVADTGWAKCAWGKIYGQWICGSAIFVYDMEKFVPKNLMEKIAKYRVTSFCAPPTIYRFMITEDFSQYDFSALEHCTTAGEPLNPEVFNQFKSLTGLMIYESFGQSESTPMIGTYPGVDPVPGSMGKPSPGYSIRMLGDDGNEVDPGEEGEIVIDVSKEKPIGLFLGYYRDQEKTDQCWKHGNYHTGDIGWVDENGYYWYVGRADDVIKSSGYRIGPFEVESALMEHPAVIECAISAVPDETRGQIVKATVVLARGYAPSDELVKDLQNHVKKVTAPYKYPRIVTFVDELPKTVSGKIKRKEIRERDMEKA